MNELVQSNMRTPIEIALDIDSEEGMGTTVIITIPTMKKLEMNPELSNTTQIPTATAQVQVVERKQD